MSISQGQDAPKGEDVECVAQAARYNALAYAMESGVAMMMGFDSKPTEPKHLRVGVNTAHVDHSGLVSLLITAGVFTELEYRTALADAMAAEVKVYETRLSERYGTTVSLA